MGYWNALIDAIGLLKDLSILEKLSSKLINKPDVAAEKLALVLSELAKSYQALDDALVNLATLSFNDQDDINEAREYLLKAQGGRIAAEIGGAKGHCHKIWNNYERYLKGWFSRVLDKKEADDLEELFNNLRGLDTVFVGSMDHLSNQAQTTADNLLSLIDNGRVKEAKSIVKDMAQELSDPRKALSQGMVTLWKLQANFTEISGAV